MSDADAPCSGCGTTDENHPDWCRYVILRNATIGRLERRLHDLLLSDASIRMWFDVARRDGLSETETLYRIVGTLAADKAAYLAAAIEARNLSPIPPLVVKP